MNICIYMRLIFSITALFIGKSRGFNYEVLFARSSCCIDLRQVLRVSRECISGLCKCGAQLLSHGCDGCGEPRSNVAVMLLED